MSRESYDYSIYEHAMTELDREARDKLLERARGDSKVSVAEYLKLETLDQALTDIEERKERK